MYIILSGGFFGLSHKQEIWGFTPLKLGDANRGVDFIVKIEGLPDELVKPEGTKVHYTYFCNTCNAFVPEWDMERKQGCFFHSPDPRREESPEWRIGVLEAYKNAQKPWITNAVRIWLDNQPGQEKWIAIKRFIEHNYPVNKSLAEITPRPVGTRTEWLIEESEVPYIDLNKQPVKAGTTMSTVQATDMLLKRVVELENLLKKKELEIKSERAIPVGTMLKCDICGKICNGNLGLTTHKRTKHKGGKNVLNDTSDAIPASSADHASDKDG